jgi:hypothetical protein
MPEWSEHELMQTGDKTQSIPQTRHINKHLCMANVPLGANYLSSLGSNTNFTSLTIVGKYFSADPCKPENRRLNYMQDGSG